MTGVMGGLDEALELSNNMLANAKESQWEQVHKMSTRRLQCLQAFFSTSVSSDQEQEVAERILQLQALDRQLLVLCDAQREVLSKQLLDLHDSKKSAAAYLGNL